MPGFVNPALQKPKIKPGVPMRGFFWKKIGQSKLSGTVWLNLSEDKTNLNKKELESLFAKKSSKAISRGGGKGGGAAATKAKTNKPVSYLDGKRQQNGGIAMSRVRLSADEVFSVLVKMDMDKLSLDKVKILEGLVPTAEESSALADHDLSNPKMVVALDRFMISLNKIPLVKGRLTSISTMLTLEEKREDVDEKIDIVGSGVRKLKSSKKFKTILEHVLALGNYLNGGTARGQCVGFSLDSLKKLETVKSTDGKLTLMQYLVKWLAEKDPDLLEISELAGMITDASKQNLSQAQADTKK